MNSIPLIVITLLILLPLCVNAYINCYTCTLCPYISGAATTGSVNNICYSYISGGSFYRGGALSCTNASATVGVQTGFACCTTDLCNAAMTTKVNLFTAGIATIIAFSWSLST